MPRVVIPTRESGFTLILSPNEMDNIREMAARKEASIIEVIEACFVIGSMKMTESLEPQAYST